jgi:hypothetical protein
MDLAELVQPNYDSTRVTQYEQRELTLCSAPFDTTTIFQMVT